jgi:pimeloyl-ACP methyl ester carboxylesterase
MTPILLLPGLLCDARLWRDQIAALADIAAPVVADLTQDDRLEAMAERALATMPQHFAVAGLSMGGYVAFALLRIAPERISRLLLMDTSARPDTEYQARRRRALIALSGSGRFHGVAPRMLPTLLHPDRLGDPVLAAEVSAMAARVGRGAFVHQQTAILNRPDSRADLAAIHVPTLVAVGAGDQLTPLPMAEEIAVGIPGARLEIIAGCGHLPPMEDPDRTSALMRNWLTT